MLSDRTANTAVPYLLGLCVLIPNEYTRGPVKHGHSFRLFRCGIDIQFIWNMLLWAGGKPTQGIRCDMVWVYVGCVSYGSVILGVSYWSLHQNHASTINYRNTDGVDGLSRRIQQHVQEERFCKENSETSLIRHHVWASFRFSGNKLMCGMQPHYHPPGKHPGASHWSLWCLRSQTHLSHRDNPKAGTEKSRRYISGWRH